jgi:nucleotide-binding universal stress UspA family protein
MIQKILVPIDGSEHSKKAIEFATGVSQQYGSELYLIHVVADKTIPPEILEYIESENVEGALGKVSAELISEGIMKVAQNQVKATGLKIAKAMVSRGDPAEEVVKFAKNNDIDMIIIGSRGLGQIKGILLGSVSSKVCHLAECTCVTVK